MVDIGDRVQFASRKVGQGPRTGVVTGVTGQVIIVRWSSGEESRLVPGPGALTVVGRGTVTPRAGLGIRKWLAIVVAVVALIILVGGGLVLLLTGSNAQQVVRDDFKRANTVVGLGAAHGAKWQSLRGQYGIQDDMAALISAVPGAGQLAVVEVGKGDGHIDATLALSASGAGIAFRVVDSNNFWALVAVPNYGTWNIVRVVNGQMRFPGNTGLSKTLGVRAISVQLNGDQITVSIDGHVRHKISDASLRNGTKAGLITFYPRHPARWTSFSAEIDA